MIQIRNWTIGSRGSGSTSESYLKKRRLVAVLRVHAVVDPAIMIVVHADLDRVADRALDRPRVFGDARIEEAAVPVLEPLRDVEGDERGGRGFGVHVEAASNHEFVVDAREEGERSAALAVDRSLEPDGRADQAGEVRGVEVTRAKHPEVS